MKMVRNRITQLLGQYALQKGKLPTKLLISRDILDDWLEVSPELAIKPPKELEQGGCLEIVVADKPGVIKLLDEGPAR